MPIRTLLPLLSCLGLTAASAALLPPYPHRALEPDERLPDPITTPASPAAERAIAQFRIPAGFEVKLWAAEPMLANPVAFAFDEQGRAFISETHRYRSSVLDIRNYMEFLEQDLACETIEDREHLIDEVFGEQAAELAIESELVRLVQDTDGDGVADTSSVFATGFNSKLDGIASGVLARGGKVWFTNIPSLWQFDTDATGTQETARHELLRGFGVRFGYTGHDFHGLIFGPDGKLYSSIGDRSTNVTAPDGRQVKVLSQGAVFRSNPDGSDFEVVATGLRNPQELAFNEYGDLLTGDNDCDNGDLERLVHVVEGGDSGWSSGYQFAPRGRAGPWMSDNLWKPEFPGRPAYLLPPIANIEDGPSGIAYYPGTGFSADYDHTLFITHFKGSVARSGIQSYKVLPHGASYEVTESKPFLWGTLPTDLSFAPDGRFYFLDWVVGWPKSKMGRIYAMTPSHRSAAEIAQSAEVHRLLSGGLKDESIASLTALLGHPDQRVRTEAQFEFVARGAGSIRQLTAVATNRLAGLSPQLARLHALWALGQLRPTSLPALSCLGETLTDRDPEVRAQSAKLAGDHDIAGHTTQLTALLADDSPRVQFFAAQSLGKLGRTDATAPLLELLRRNNNADAYVRHAATYALFRLADRPALAAAETDPSAAVRLGVILAYRRLQEPRIANFLHDTDPYLVREAALAINDDPINSALPALADLLGTGDLHDEPVQLRAINAHLRLGRPADAVALATYAARAEVPADLREEALTQLADWAAPFQRDRLMGEYRPLPARDAAPAIAAVEEQLPVLLAGAPRSVKRTVLQAVRKLKATAATPRVRALVAAAAEDGEIRAQALALLDDLGDAQLLDAVAVAGASDSPDLRMATLPILAKLSPAQALPILTRMTRSGTAAEQQAAFAAIAKLADPAAAELLLTGLKRLQAGDVPYLAQFELLDAAEASPDARVQQALTDVKAAWAASGDDLAPYRGALEGGDARQGWRLFNEHPVLACTRCHKANGEGGNAGPDLSDIADRKPPEYILESIINPNAAIAAGFDVVAFTLQDGSFVTGTILSENSTAITLRDADGKEQTIDPSQVKERAAAPSSMPPIFALVLKRHELRDLMAFVKNLRPRDLPSGEGEPRATHGE